MIVLVIISILVAITITSMVLSSRNQVTPPNLNHPLSASKSNLYSIKIIYNNSKIESSYNQGKDLPSKCCDTRDLSIVGGKKSSPFSHSWLALLESRNDIIIRLFIQH